MRGPRLDAGVPFWRVFPWDRGALPGPPFSPEYEVPPARQTRGRFDLGTSGVLYLAETPEHAAAEVLRPFAGRRLKAAHLSGAVHPLALVRVELEAKVAEKLADLTRPAVLLRLGISPDALASRDRSVTQAIARKLHDAGAVPGFRWWSALHGDWHTVLLFLDRIGGWALRYDEPVALAVKHPAVLAAARALEMELPRRVGA